MSSRWASGIAPSSGGTRSLSRKRRRPACQRTSEPSCTRWRSGRLGAVGLHNAATAEFLFDPDRRFWFLEVNARLQVEHGVTELVTDLDLVAEQLWLAAGEPLSDAVREVAAMAAAPGRHAVEVRLAAEDPARGFAPVPGRVGAWVMPSGPGVRVDTAIRPGERVPPDYDPMIAKVMTVGRDRSAALRRMRRALDEVVVSGIQTTLPFHRALVRDPAFADETGSTLSTDWVGERWDGPRRPSRRRRGGGDRGSRKRVRSRTPNGGGVFAQRRSGAG